MSFPNDRKYTKDHEWAKLEGDTVVVGITEHAQSALGDVVYVELPEVGRQLTKGETFGVVESIKAVSDLYSPIEGTVSATNDPLKDNPSQINQDPHGGAWLIKLKGVGSLDDLMDAKAYEQYVNSQQ